MIQSANTVLAVGLIFTAAAQAQAQSMLQVNKIKAGEDTLIIHAEFSVLSEKIAIGGLNFKFFDEVSGSCNDDLSILRQKNQDNQFLSDAGNGFLSFMGKRSFHKLWLVKTAPDIYNGLCADQTFLTVVGSYSETSYELQRPSRNLPIGAFEKADTANVTRRSYFYSLTPEIDPPLESTTKTEIIDNNGFIALTYFYDIFQFEANPALIKGPAIISCLGATDGEVREFSWPLGEISRAPEKFMGRTVSIIPIISMPGEENFAGASHCNVSYEVVTSAFGGESQTISFKLAFE